MLFGIPLTEIYFYTLTVVGVITILFVLFSVLFDGVFADIDFLKPTLILVFITLFAASGYVLEKSTSWNSILVTVVAGVIAFFLDTVLKVCVLTPMKKY
jgi:hypothetical protein